MENIHPPINSAFANSEVKTTVLPSQDKNYGGVLYQLMYTYPTTNKSEVFNRPVPLPIAVPEGHSPTIPVTCGSVPAKMHLNLFICPGIHQPCIEIKGELISPKQFTVRGDKEKQKDWKASIRIGKSTLRTHMEASTIDFYDHSNRCSGKCQSRNYVNAPQERDEVINNRKLKRTANHDLLQSELRYEMGGSQEESSEKAAACLAGRKPRGRPRGSVNRPRQPKMDPSSNEFFFEDFFTGEEVNPPAPIPSADETTGITAYLDILQCLQNDPQHFWEQLHSTGVIGHFIDDIIVSAINLKQTALLQNTIPAPVANTLTRTVFALGLQTTIVHRVQAIERSVNVPGGQQQQQELREDAVEFQMDRNNISDTLNNNDPVPRDNDVSDTNNSNTAKPETKHMLREIKQSNSNCMLFPETVTGQGPSTSYSEAAPARYEVLTPVVLKPTKIEFSSENHM